MTYKKRIITKDFLNLFDYLQVAEIGNYNTYIDFDLCAYDDMFAWWLGISVKDFQKAIEKDNTWFNCYMTYKPRTKDKKILLFFNDRDFNYEETIELVGGGKKALLKLINQVVKI